MELTDKTSHLMLFCVLILLRTGKTTFAKTLRTAPLSKRTRRLADLLATARPQKPGRVSVTLHPAMKKLANADGEYGQPDNPDHGEVHPLFGSWHISKSGSVTEIHTQDMPLRCPVCGNDATVDLDAWQAEHLRIRGHLELYCRYCGTNSLWERADAVDMRPPTLVI